VKSKEVKESIAVGFVAEVLQGQVGKLKSLRRRAKEVGIHPAMAGPTYIRVDHAARWDPATKQKRDPGQFFGQVKARRQGLCR
jgi:hypothetical protein